MFSRVLCGLPTSGPNPWVSSSKTTPGTPGNGTVITLSFCAYPARNSFSKYGEKVWMKLIWKLGVVRLDGLVKPRRPLRSLNLSPDRAQLNWLKKRLFEFKL